MKFSMIFLLVTFLGSGYVSFSQTTSSKRDASSAPPSNLTTEYPKDSGVLIENSGWIEVPDETPSITKVKRAIVHSFTYGAVPAKAVSIYDGAHAQVQIPPSQPTL